MQIKESDKDSYDYGCVMIYFKFPEINKIHKLIDKDDLYEEKGNDKYGLEKSSHCTLLYGLHKNVTNDQVKKIIDEYKFPKTIKINKVSIFDTAEKWDVLKFDIEEPLFNKINKQLRKECDNTVTFKDYHAHLTIAYVKKGKGKEYVKKIKEQKIDYELDVEKVVYSHADKTKYSIKVELKENVNLNQLISLLESYSNKKVVLKENDESIDDFFKPKNLKSREEKYEKELEAECQEKYHMSIDKFKNIYFSFFDQMDEPERAWAKECFDIDSAIKYGLPEKIDEAILQGVHLNSDKHGGLAYWRKIYNKY